MIGFVGLGNMGAYMARNLIKNGQKLVVYDVKNAAVEALVKEAGVEKASSPAEVAERCAKIVSMVPTNEHVHEVYAGPKGVFSTAKAGTLCMDSSTIEPSVSRKMAELAKAKSVTFLDTPVSGGVVGARDATLTFMVGGEQQGFKQAEPILKAMGKNIVYCGPSGNGQAAKICNNMLLAITMIGTSEALILGQKLGLDAKLLSGIINTSSGRCWSSEVYNPVPGIVPNIPPANNYAGGFGTALITKDLGLAQNAATSVKAPTPLGSLAHQIYRIMCQTGYADRDFAAVYQMLASREDQK